MRTKIVAGLAAAAAALTLSATQAHANSMLELISGGSTVFGSLNGSGNDRTWTGAVGGWTINQTSGTASPLDGVPTIGIDLLSFDATGGAGASSLTIIWSDDDYSIVPAGYQASIGGTISGSTSVTYSTYYGTLGTTTNTLTGASVFTTSSFSGDKSGAVLTGTSTPYALTEKVVIGAAGAGVRVSFDAGLTLPDGGSTVALLGGAFTALALVRSRFTKSK